MWNPLEALPSHIKKKARVLDKQSPSRAPAGAREGGCLSTGCRWVLDLKICGNLITILLARHAALRNCQRKLMNMISLIFFILTLATSGHALDKATQHSNVKAIIFDCDGTLIDTEEVVYEAWRYAFQRQGYELAKEEYQLLMNEHLLAGLPTAGAVFAELGAELIGYNCAGELLSDMSVYCDISRAKGFPPIESTLNFLHQLAKEKEVLGLKIGLASGSRKHQILCHLRHLEIEDYFDVILSGYDDLDDYIDAEGTNKPKPYIYLHAAKMLGLAPEQCIAIEDSQTGVASAVGAGCITVAVPNAFTVQHDLSRAALKMESFNGVSPIAFLQMIVDLKSFEMMPL